MKTVFALYDSRYTHDEESSTCYSVCDTYLEAAEEKREDFPDAVIVKETLEKTGKNKFIVVSSEIVKF